MNIRQAIHLLTVSVFIIIGLLVLTLGFALTGNETIAPVPTCDVGENPSAADQLVNEGKKVWNSNSCGACHAKNMTTDATGPALGGVTERWADYPREDLYAWIRNNGKLRANEHPRALAVYQEWNKAAMNIYPGLTDEEIEALLVYIER